MLTVKEKQMSKKGNIEIMRTYKGKGSTGWTGIDNKIINNNLLSIQARFILIFMLSKNDNKDELSQEIIAKNCNLSVKQVSRYLNELKQFKHLEIVKSEFPNEKGQYVYKYRLIESSSVLPVDINHKTSVSDGNNKNKNNLKLSNSNTLSQLKPQDTIGHQPQDIDVRFLYNTNINNNTISNTEKVEVKKEVPELKQISDLTEKQKIYCSYKNLRKNDPEYLELLKQVCKETSEEVLKDWLEARPFIQTQGNIPYYILNSIQNKRVLPEAYLIQKVEKTRKDLFDKWSNPYQNILKEKLNFSRIDDSLANLLNQILVSLEQVKTYHNSKLIEFKANETNQKMLELNTKFLQNLINNSSIEMIQELFSKFFHSQNLKNKCRYFRSLKDDSYQSLLNSIQMINHYVSKGI